MLIRDIVEEEMEQAFAGHKSAKAALDSAVARGNEMLRKFEQAKPPPETRAVAPLRGAS